MAERSLKDDDPRPRRFLFVCEAWRYSIATENLHDFQTLRDLITPLHPDGTALVVTTPSHYRPIPDEYSMCPSGWTASGWTG